MKKHDYLVNNNPATDTQIKTIGTSIPNEDIIQNDKGELALLLTTDSNEFNQKYMSTMPKIKPILNRIRSPHLGFGLLLSSEGFSILSPIFDRNCLIIKLMEVIF